MKIIKSILNIVQIPIKMALILCIVFVSYSYLNKVFVTPDVDYGQSFHSLPEDSMDIIVLGSSHAQYSFVPSFVYEDTGLYSYVLGSPCQPLEVSYEMLKEAYKTQNPKLVILEVYTAMPLRKICEADVCYVSAQYQMTGDEKYNTINYLEKSKAKEYYNVFLNNHNNWKNFDSIEDFKINDVHLKKDENISDTFGYVEMGLETPVENYWYPISFDDIESMKLDTLDLESLNNIYKLCKENDTELLLYKTPIDSMDEENQAYLNAVWDWANEKNIRYIDFLNIAKDIDFNMVFHSDSYHANYAGASIITKYLVENAINEYSFNHKNNDFLNNKYNSSALYYDMNSVAIEVNPMRYLDRMKHDDAIILIKYEHSSNKMEEQLNDKLSDLGIGEKLDNHKDYFAIIKDGKELVSDIQEVNYKINNKNITVNKDEIIINGEKLNTEGLFNLVMCDENLERKVIKNIDYSGYPWEYGYDMYIKIKNNY